MMMLSGLYEESGRWAYTTGLPAKTGVGGGMVAIVPGTLAIAAFFPRLNQAGKQHPCDGGGSARGSAAAD